MGYHAKMFAKTYVLLQKIHDGYFVISKASSMASIISSLNNTTKNGNALVIKTIDEAMDLKLITHNNLK
jgi:hypothetical protein